MDQITEAPKIPIYLKEDWLSHGEEEEEGMRGIQKTMGRNGSKRTGVREEDEVQRRWKRRRGKETR